jgi:glutaredoxin
MPVKTPPLARMRKGLLLFALSLALALLAIDRYAAYMHRPAKDATQVVIYTTTWCPYCKQLRRDLAASKVPYVEYDVEKSVQGQLGMWALRGRGVPVSAVGSKVVYGYRIDQIAAGLKDIGYTYLPPAGDSGD